MIPIHCKPKIFASSWRSRCKISVNTTSVHSVRFLSTVSTVTGPVTLTGTEIRGLSTSPRFEVDDAVIPRNESFTRVDLHNAQAPFMIRKPAMNVNHWFTVDNISTIPGLCADGAIRSLPQLDLQNCSKAALMDYFINSWAMTESLLSSLRDAESFIKPPYHELRHPMIFYYGHPAALYVNKLRVAGLIPAGINEYFESLFETGVDEMSWDDLSKNKMSWPSVEAVKAYRRQVFELVKGVISAASEEQVRRIDQNSPFWALALSMEHERIHIETSSVLISELPLKYVQRPVLFPAYHPSVPTASARVPVPGEDFPLNSLLPVAAQSITLGKFRDMPSYGWDNEYGHKTVEVPAFKCSQFQVSNGEFFEFVSEGGYSRVELWTEAGWGWRAFRNAKHPLHWVRSGPQGLHQYKLRLLFDEVEMPWSWPVTVNYHEAVAFCNWRSLKTGANMRVLTEPEFHAINDSAADPVLDRARGSMFDKFGINANLSHASPCPVDARPANSKGFSGVLGNAWEWCNDFFSALPGFTVHPYYEDFSTPCFDGLHNVIKGGSFISTGNEASVFSRFHFRPHFHQHASFRVVEQQSGASMVTSDTDAPGPFVGQYPFRRSAAGVAKELSRKHEAAPLARHFGAVTPSFGLNAAGTLQELVLEGMQTAGIKHNAKILDIGCGVGAMALGLAPFASRVIGVDHSAENIAVARRIAAGELSHFALPGDEEQHSIRLPRRDVGTIVDFRQSDPMCVPAEFAGFDVVLVSDVLDKVSSPNSVLGRLAGPRGLVRPGGLLVVSGAYAWDENVTPKSLWIHGREALTQRLAADFRAIKVTDLPVFWQEKTRELRGTLLDVQILQRTSK